MNKNELRRLLKEKRNSLTQKEVNESSTIITDSLINFIKQYNCKDFFVYNSFQNEVSTNKFISYLLENNKNVYLPKVNKEEMVAISYTSETKTELSNFNILEPTGSPTYINNFICIVPLIGVDTKGNRIGFGKGYYDKFLKDKNCIKIGICYDFQIIDYQIETNPYDIPLNIIISEKRIIKI